MTDKTSGDRDDEDSAAGGGVLSLFAKHEKVYPAHVRGRYRRLKLWLMLLQLGLYYALPWVRWDRGEAAPDQAVLIDIPGRRFFFFFIEVWPQETYVFAAILILAAMALFMVTSILGRIWCGFSCPQTVWTDLYTLVEEWIEGDRNARMRLDRAPFSLSKAGKKVLKHGLWLLIGLATGGAFVFYFNDTPTLWRSLLEGHVPFVAAFWAIALTLSTYVMAGFAREQVCAYMCPYARFQGAMFDMNTLIVTYDTSRGEPRGKQKDDGTDGDCINCLRCVAVCPTGIDIRDGQQYQCINCGLCVDACNEIMTKVGKPKGLVRFDTLAHINRGTLMSWRDLFSLSRPRPMIYAFVIALMGLAILYTVTIGRVMLDLNVLRERNPMYVQLADGSIRNIYTLHVVNKTHEDRAYALTSSQEHAKLSIWQEEASGTPPSGEDKAVLHVKAESVGTFRLFVDVPDDEVKGGSHDIHFTVKDQMYEDTYESVFVAPKSEDEDDDDE